MKTIRVADVYKLHGKASIELSREASLEDVIHRLASESSIRGVFLLDEEQRFSGMVSRAAILKWAEFQLFSKWKNSIIASEVAKLVDPVKAKYLARGDWRSFGIKEDDTLEEAINQMMSLGEDILPVLDNDGKIIGDLTLSEVLLKAIEVGKQSPS